MTPVTDNPTTSGSQITSANGWVIGPNGRLFSPATGTIEGNNFFPHAYGGGYYVKLAVSAAIQPYRATEPLLTYAEVTE